MHWDFEGKLIRLGLIKLDDHKQVVCHALGRNIGETLPQQVL